MRDIRYMSYDKLYENFQISLNLEYMEHIITDRDVLAEFYRVFPRDGSNTEQHLFLKGFFKKHQRAIDNEAYVFFTLKSLSEGTMILDNKNAAVRTRCREALKDSRYTFFEPNYAATRAGDEIRMLTAAELIGNTDPKKPSKNEERVKAMKKVIALESLFSVHSPKEMFHIYGMNPSLNALIGKLGLVDSLDSVHPLSVKERVALLKDSNMQKLHTMVYENRDKMDPDVMRKFYGRMPEFLEKYPDCFDLDKMLLICAFRVKETLETQKLDPETTKTYSRCLLLMAELIESKKTKVEGLDATMTEDSEKKDYSYKDLLLDCNRITEHGFYLSREKENYIITKIDEDPAYMLDMDPEYLSLIEFSTVDVERFAKSPGVFEYLTSHEIASKVQVQRVLEKGIPTQEEVIALYEKALISKNELMAYVKNDFEIEERLFKILSREQLLSSEKMLEYYMDSRVSLDLVDSLSEEEKSKLAELLTPEMLMELYKDSSRQDEYIRYSELYRDLIISKADQAKKIELGEAIIEATDGDFEDEDLINLYDQHLISLTTLESWSGPHLVTKLMRDAKLRPIDVKEICMNGNYDSVLQIMRDPKISRTNKLAVFYTTFSDEDDHLTPEQKELKELAKSEALRELGLKDTKYVTPGLGGTRTTPKTPTKQRTEYVLEPMNRWNLIRLLDEDYSYEMLDSGMMIFKLPNVKNGVVILEKMFRKDVPDYGRATKVITMPIGNFERIKPTLIRSGDIPPFVVDRNPNLANRLESVCHTVAWPKRIAELCGYKTDPRRTKENVEAIEREIAKTEKSRRKR